MPIILNGRLVKSFIFPGGEVQIQVEYGRYGRDFGDYYITALLYDSGDILQLLLTFNAISQHPTGIKKRIHLRIPYLPYARQDRVCAEGEALSAQVMADIINGCQANLVELVDPHSDVTPALIKNAQVKALADLFADSDLKHHLSGWLYHYRGALISPDAGAEKKIYAAAKAAGSQGMPLPVICARKRRDAATGTISGVEIDVPALRATEAQQFLIVDDICDGGRTFIELAKAIRATGDGRRLMLYVTHGIFSNGLGDLLKYYDKIYCWHAFPKVPKHEKLVVIHDYMKEVKE